MGEPPPHLVLTHEGPVPLDLLDAFEASVAVDGVVVRREARLAPRGPASMTLLMFTGVGLYLTRTYFDGLSNDVGLAHAGKLQAALGVLSHQLTALLVRRVTTNALAVEDRFSPVFTLWIARDAESWFKMLLPLGLSPEELDAAQTAYLAFALAYHNDALDPEDADILTALRPLAGVVLLAYDVASRTIQPVDPFEGRGRDLS